MPRESLEDIQKQYAHFVAQYNNTKKKNRKKRRELLDDMKTILKRLTTAVNNERERDPVHQAKEAKRKFGDVIQELKHREFRINHWAPHMVAETKRLPPGRYSFSATLRTQKVGEAPRNRKIARTDFTGGSVQDYLMQIHQLYYRSAIDVQLNDIVIRPIASITEAQVRARGAFALKMAGIGDLKDYKPHPGQCFIDFVLVRAMEAHMRLTRPQIIEALGGEVEILLGVDQHQAVDFCKLMNFTIRIFDPFLRLSVKHIAVNPKLVLNVIWNNNHCYGILDPAVNKAAVSKLELGVRPEVDFEGAQEWLSAEVDQLEVVQKMDLRTPPKGTLLVDVQDLSFVARVAVEQTGTVINQLELNAQGRLIRFLHPNGSLIVAAPDLLQRRRVLQKLFTETKYLGFKFANQSYSVIGRLCAEHRIGVWRESHYPPVLLEILKEIDIAPAIYSLSADLHLQTAVSVDYIREYTAVLQNMKHPYPIFNCWDEYTDVEPLAGYAEIEFTLNAKFYAKNFWPLSMLKDLRENGIPVKVFRYLKASHWLEAKHLADLAVWVHEMFPVESKHIINHFIGLLGRKYDRYVKMALTTSIEVADAMTNKYPNLDFYDTHGVYFMKQTDSVMRHRGHLPIWHQVIARSLIDLHLMTEKIRGPQSVILGYNTDSVKLTNPLPFVNGKKIGEFRTERYKPAYGNLHPGKPGALAVVPEWRNGLGLVMGAPGSGKTRLLCEQSDKDSLAMSWTCRGVENINMNPDNTNGIRAETLDHKFYKLKPGALVLKAKTRIDEFSMLPLEHLINLWDQKCRMPDVEIQMYGDDNQCLTLDGSGVEYQNSALIKWLVGGMITKLPYLPESGRYDAKTHDVLQQLLLSGKLPANEKRLFERAKLTLCATHHTRFNINWLAFPKWAPKGLTYGDWFVGCPVISYKNFGPVKNSHFFHVMSLANPVVLKRSDGAIVEIKKDDLNDKNFRYGWAETIRRWQGGKITEQFNIVELDKMDLRDIYTAIGRTTRWSDVGFDGEQSYEFERAKKWLPYGKLEPRICYEDQYLYKYDSGDGKVDYIGRTNDPLRRAEEHSESGKKGMQLTHYYKATKTQIDKLETQEIQKAIEAGAQLSNKKKVKAALKPRKEYTIKVIQTRFTPHDQPERSRWRVRYNDDGKEQVEYFSYKECTKNEALQLALEKQKELTNKFGL